MKPRSRPGTPNPIMYSTRIKGTPLKRSVYATATSRKGKNTGPGMPLTTAITRARIKMKTSETVKILTLSQNAPRTEGSRSEPTRDCQRCCGLKNRSATTPLPGASTTTIAMIAKKSTVLALDTSTPLFPRAREPRPGSLPGADGPGAAGPPSVTLLLQGGDVQVLLQVLLLELLQGPIALHLAEDLIYASDERVALLEEHAELLVARVLPDYGRAVYFEVAQVYRGHQVGDEDVDLAALQRGLGVVGGVVDLGIRGRLHRLVDEIEGRRADLGPYSKVLEVGDALRFSGRRVLQHEHALGVVEVAVREVDGRLALFGYGDLVDVEVEIFRARRVGLVERLDGPHYREVHALCDLARYVALEPRVVFGISFEPRRVGRLVRGDRQLALLEERRVVQVARNFRIFGTRLRRGSAAADEQQNREEEPDQDTPLSHVTVSDLLSRRKRWPVRRVPDHHIPEQVYDRPGIVAIDASPSIRGLRGADAGILVAPGLFGEHSSELGRRRRVRDERVRAAEGREPAPERARGHDHQRHGGLLYSRYGGAGGGRRPHGRRRLEDRQRGAGEPDGFGEQDQRNLRRGRQNGDGHRPQDGDRVQQEHPPDRRGGAAQGYRPHREHDGTPGQGAERHDNGHHLPREGGETPHRVAEHNERARRRLR